MKIGSGSDRPMLKVNRNLLCSAVLIVVGSIVILAGCGQISLNQLLENEDPGEFRLSPDVASVPDGSTVTLEGQGGFKPYAYTLLTGNGDLDSRTGVYVASGGTETAEIEATDYFGSTDTSQIKVYEALKLQVNGQFISKITIYDNQTVAFDADGGVVAAGYDYFVNNLLTYTSGGNGQWTFAPAAAGTYLIVVEDDLENSALVTVTVVASVGGNLAIDPTETFVLQGGTIHFSGLNVAGTAVYTATAGSFDGTSPDDTYTAPAAPFTGEVTVTLTDSPSGNSVNAKVLVLDSDPADLEISPSSLADLGYGDEVVFSVSGGLLPYTFWLEYDGGHGTLEQISATQARYSAPGFNTTEWVWVEDGLGDSKRVKVKVKAK